MKQKTGHSALLPQSIQNLIQFFLVIYFLHLHSFSYTPFPDSRASYPVLLTIRPQACTELCMPLSVIALIYSCGCSKMATDTLVTISPSSSVEWGTFFPSIMSSICSAAIFARSRMGFSAEVSGTSQ